MLPHAATRSARKGPRSRLSARSALQNALATHLDREHLHNHFLINSVSFVNGKKFNDNKRCYFQMREALDEALSMCLEHRDLQLALRDRGYVLNCDPNRKYATIRSIGGGKPVRLYRLGQEYDLPAIEARLAENRRSFWRGGFAIYHRPERAKNKRRYLLLKGSIRALCGKGDLFSLYLHYCYALGILPKNSVRRPLSPELREECRRLDRYDRQTRLLAREKLQTAEDVQRFIAGKEAELAELADARQKCYNRLRRCDDPDEISAVKAQRHLLTLQMKTCRQELATARSILGRAEMMKQNLRAERAMTIGRENGSRQKIRQQRRTRER